jgi:protein-S-isoprenylcysteine O-methyltransferase Ste14
MFAAGRWNWLAGWLYVIIFLLFDAATALVVIPRSPDLLIERSRAVPGAKKWDKTIMPLASGFLPLISWIIAGLDQRLEWNPEISLGTQAIGLIMTLIGHALVVWSMSANPFFSPLVRIQKERGHNVAAGGPYRFVRHPGYLGAMVFSISIPILLGSWWAVIPGFIAALLFIIRTFLEDQTLHEELSGYREYAGVVKYRLVPGIW